MTLVVALVCTSSRAAAALPWLSVVHLYIVVYCWEDRYCGHWTTCYLLYLDLDRGL